MQGPVLVKTTDVFYSPAAHTAPSNIMKANQQGERLLVSPKLTFLVLLSTCVISLATGSYHPVTVGS